MALAVESRNNGLNGKNPVPFSLPLYQTEHAELPHPAFRQPSARAHAEGSGAAYSAWTSNLRIRTPERTGAARVNASWCDGDEVKIESDADEQEGDQHRPILVRADTRDQTQRASRRSCHRDHERVLVPDMDLSQSGEW